jgi:AraC family transcriptional regulator
MLEHVGIVQWKRDQAKFVDNKYSRIHCIAEVAVRVGFCDQSHFTGYFKRIVGVTPKKFLLFVSQ